MNILIHSQMNFESFVRLTVEKQVLYKEKSLMQVALITAKKNPAGCSIKSIIMASSLKI